MMINTHSIIWDLFAGGHSRGEILDAIYEIDADLINDVADEYNELAPDEEKV